MAGRIGYNPCDDYYERLGVSPFASQRQVLCAYRAAVKRCHPGAGGDPTGRDFLAVCDAYSVVADPVKRSFYNASRNRHGGPPDSSYRGSE